MGFAKADSLGGGLGVPALEAAPDFTDARPGDTGDSGRANVSCARVNGGGAPLCRCSALGSAASDSKCGPSSGRLGSCEDEEDWCRLLTANCLEGMMIECIGKTQICE